MNRKILGLGLPTIITIFVVLCLTCFSVVSYLSSANAYKRAKAYSVSVREYYDGENKAIDIKKKVENGNYLGVEVDGNNYRYRVKIGDNAYLEVGLEEIDGKFVVKRWQMVSGINEKYAVMSFDV